MAASSFRAQQQQQQSLQQSQRPQYGGSASGSGLSSYSREPGPGSQVTGSNASSNMAASTSSTSAASASSSYANQQSQHVPSMNAPTSSTRLMMNGGGNGNMYPQQQQHQQYGSSSNNGQHGSGGGYAHGPSAGASATGPQPPQGPGSSLSNNGYPNSSSNGNNASGSSSRHAASSNSQEEIENSRRIARSHYEEFRHFLEMEGMRDPNARVNAREKLTRLTRQQFQELSTDVYDELVRRQRSDGRGGGGNSPTSAASEGEFLPVKPEFHPKRNQARQKLATLPKIRFRDLASDVYFELERRYPEFREPEVLQIPEPPQQQEQYGQRRPQFTHQNSSNVANEVIIPNKSTLVEEDVGMPPSSSTNSMAGPSPQQQQSGLGRLRGYSGSSDLNGTAIPPPRRSGERDRDVSPPNAGGGGGGAYDREPISPTSMTGGRKSNDVPRGQMSNGPTSPDWAGHSLARASEASSIGTRLVGAYGGPRSDAGGDSAWEREQHAEELEKVRSDYEFRIATMQSRLQGLERDLDDSRARERNLEAQLDKMDSRHEDVMQNVQQLERELAEQQQQQQRDAIPPYSEEDKEEIARLRAELDSASERERRLQQQQKQRGGGGVEVDNLKRELEGLMDTLREMNARQDELASEREADGARIEELQSEVQDWKKRYESAKTELRDLKATSGLFVKPGAAAYTGQDDDYMPTSPEGGITDAHVTAFQSSIDELLIGGRSNAPSSVIIATKTVINAVARIDEDVQEYEASGRADHALSEEERDRLYALKSKCNATLSNLTTAARTHATGHGLSPVSLLDAAASHLSVTIIELVRLLHLRKAGTPLPPLVNGAVNGHAQSSSTSSAGSRTAQLQFAPRGSAQQRQPAQTSNNAFPARSGSLQQPQQQRQPNGRLSPAHSFRSRIETASPDPHEQRSLPPSNSDRSLAASMRQQTAGTGYPARQQSLGEQTARGASPQPPMQQRPDYADDDEQSQHEPSFDTARQQYQQQQHADEADWNELKNYLEQQTEAIVQSITALLAAIRGGAQANKLEENLSQIITIVSSIVAILQEKLPAALHAEAEPVVNDLADNCDKLVELQNTASAPGAAGAFSKQTKQQMATASFGIAKSLKSMNSILSSNAGQA